MLRKPIIKKYQMNSNIEKVLQISFAIFCIAFGIDKFIEFLPHCSLTDQISRRGMIATGVIEIGIGILLLLNKYTLLSLRLATAIMFGGVAMHLAKGTYDITGAAFGTILGVVLIFIQRNKSK